MKFATKAVHAGVHPDPETGAVMTPVYQTSTYAQAKPGENKGFVYSRAHNPTRTALQNSLAALENGKYGLCFSSGMAAIDAVLRLFNPGDEIIASEDLYGGSYRLFSGVYEKYGLKFHYVSMNDSQTLEEYINENTRMLWVESPTNPLMNIADIEAISSICRKNQLILAVDNTFATPYLQQPLAFGADIVMHSVTKYLGGHSDVIMGALIVNDNKLFKELSFIQNSAGAVPGPQDSFLVLRGIKTLHLRMKAHCENGVEVADFLQKHPKVDKVYWPGFKKNPQYVLAKKQMKAFGGMISFSIKGTKNDAFELMSAFKLFRIAESLGGVESLCNHPASMSHGSIPCDQKRKLGISDNLIRLSVGIEDPEDLLHDLKQALDVIS